MNKTEQGTYAPYRVVIKGTLDALTYIVVRPNGELYAGFTTAKAATEHADQHAKWARRARA